MGLNVKRSPELVARMRRVAAETDPAIVLALNS